MLQTQPNARRLRSRLSTVVVLTLVVVTAFAVPAAAGEPVIDPDFITGVSAPMAVDAPAGDGRVFVAERGGKIKIFSSATGAFIGTFLDVGGLISQGGEGGLLGMAFHPDYAVNGKFYLHLTNRRVSPGDVDIVEYSVSADPNVANPGSYRRLLRVPQPASNHNGGTVVFGSDGYLYISLGDGGSSNDPSNNGQRTGTLLGKILRIDVDGDSPYAIPDGNPYKGGGGLPEIWARGVRNPFRMAFDPATGDLYIGDVGQGAREEINAIGPTHAGANFGWKIYEGTICRPPTSGCSAPPGYVPPIHDYRNTSSTRSVIGGEVYRGKTLPGLEGTYFYADFYSSNLRSLRYSGGSGGTVSDHTNWKSAMGPVAGVVGFGTDGSGEIYMASLTKNRVSKIVLGSDRVWGDDRFETAAAVSKQAFGSASTVYVAYGFDFPDALGAAAAAAAADGPVLLVTSTGIPSATRTELNRLGPSQIVVAGGPGVISDGVVAQLNAIAPTVRSAGIDRFATAAAVSKAAFGSASTVYVAYGFDFPDALGAAAAAGAAGAPVLLVGGDSVPSATRTELNRLGPSQIVVVGGPGVISRAVQADLGAFVD